MSNNYIIRPATSLDADNLTKLAFLSKAHWGYSKEWLELWRDQLTVTSEMLAQSIAFVAEFDGKIVGFWLRLISDSEESPSGMLFIHPAHIRKGLGEKLWGAIKPAAISKGIKYLIIEADPNAELFYLKLGAQKITEKESTTIPGRVLPILRITLF